MSSDCSTTLEIYRLLNYSNVNVNDNLTNTYLILSFEKLPSESLSLESSGWLLLWTILDLSFSLGIISGSNGQIPHASKPATAWDLLKALFESHKCLRSVGNSDLVWATLSLLGPVLCAAFSFLLQNTLGGLLHPVKLVSSQLKIFSGLLLMSYFYWFFFGF